MNKNIVITVVLTIAFCCLTIVALGGILSTAMAYNDGWSPVPEAPAAPEPQITPDNGPQVTCEHKNAGKFMLLPGYSVNGGHIWVAGVEYLFVDDRVVVVTNNSDKAVEVNSSDGVGLCNDVNYDRQVAMRFSEGCDSNGCSEVKWVNMTNSGSKVKVIKK